MRAAYVVLVSIRIVQVACLPEAHFGHAKQCSYCKWAQPKAASACAVRSCLPDLVQACQTSCGGVCCRTPSALLAGRRGLRIMGLAS